MKNLLKQIALKITEKLGDGFEYKNKNSLVKDNDFYFTEIALDYYSYGTISYHLRLQVMRTFKRMECIIAPKLDEVNKMRRQGGPTEILRFDENTVKGIYNTGMSYSFRPTEEGIEKIADTAVRVIKNKFYPILDHLTTYEELHEFINNPPERFDYNSYYFPFDGMTPLRKMIIAKIVGKDYEAVCGWAINDMLEQRIKTESMERYERYKKIYYELKDQLDRGDY